MSTILDALRKAEQERELGKVPDLRSFHSTAPAPPTPRRTWPLVIAAMVVVNSGILVWLLASNDDPGAADGLLASSTETSTQGVSIPAPLPAPNPTAIQATAPIATAPITDDTWTPREPAPGVPSEAPNPVVTAAATLETQPTVLEAPRAPEPDLMNLPPQTLLDLRDTPAPQPLATMPESFQRTLPGLNLDVHVYSEDPSRRFVLINGRRYREGDWTQEGPLLETIDPEGIIMNHQQTRFTIPIER